MVLEKVQIIAQNNNPADIDIEPPEIVPGPGDVLVLPAAEKYLIADNDQANLV
jgi:hypothetical protein